MLLKLCKKPIEITWCYLSPGPAEVNWSSVTDFSGIRTWHSALAMISLDKADQATGKKKKTEDHTSITVARGLIPCGWLTSEPDGDDVAM